MKIILTITTWLAARDSAPADMLSHPDIRRMSLRELADLPVPRDAPRAQARGDDDQLAKRPASAP